MTQKKTHPPKGETPQPDFAPQELWIDQKNVEKPILLSKLYYKKNIFLIFFQFFNVNFFQKKIFFEKIHFFNVKQSQN